MSWVSRGEPGEPGEPSEPGEPGEPGELGEPAHSAHPAHLAHPARQLTLVLAHIDGRFRCLHWSLLILMVDFAFVTGPCSY